jgi:anthranilate phosphoribosyltransferase
VQVLGVYREDLTETMAGALRRLGCRSAFVVHGEGSYDEISITGRSTITRLVDNEIVTSTLAPEDLGLQRADPEAIRGGDATRNAQIALAVLKGEPGPCRDVVLMNAAAVFVAAGSADSLERGIRMAEESIDSGRALHKLEQLTALGSRFVSTAQSATG